MTYAFKLPDIGEGTAEAELGAWHVKPGDMVAEDQLLVDVMTDKATVEMTSPVSGRVVSVHGETGQTVPVGSLLVVFELEGGDSAPSPSSESPVEEKAAPIPPAPLDVPQPVLAAVSASAMVLAAPAVRKAAYERGLRLEFIQGTGPGGRVLMSDLDRPDTSRGKADLVADAIEEIRIIGLRRRISEKMQQSKRQIPHFGYVEEFDLTELEGLRADLNATRSEREPKLTLLPFFIAAVARLVPLYPFVNARFDDENGVLRRHSALHVGIATQTQGGLMVPVIRHAERLSLWDCARELSRITTAARDGSATRDELSGSTITLTSLGALGGIAATPIINHPEVAIIGPNKLQERPVVRDGRIEVRKMMNVSSSFDHRIVDGYDAARFIQEMKRLIERPSLLFVERQP